MKLSDHEQALFNTSVAIARIYPITTDNALRYADKCFRQFGDFNQEHLQIVLRSLNAEMAGN